MLELDSFETLDVLEAILLDNGDVFDKLEILLTLELPNLDIIPD